MPDFLAGYSASFEMRGLTTWQQPSQEPLARTKVKMDLVELGTCESINLGRRLKPIYCPPWLCPDVG